MHRLLREQRAAAGGTVPSRAEQLAAAERIGDSTTEPAGVTYDDVTVDGVPAQWATPTAPTRGGCSSTSTAGDSASARCTRTASSSGISRRRRAAARSTSTTGWRPSTRIPRRSPTRSPRTAGSSSNGTEAHEVVVAGDSAGGGIALALLVQARDEGVPLPAAGVLCSPWVDLAMTADSITTRADVDVRQDPAGTTWCARQFLAGQDARDPSASPLYADLAGLPPLYIQAGDWDILLDDALRLGMRARRAGVDVRLDVFPEMLHAHQIWAGNMPEADDAVARIGDYVRQHLARTPGEAS